MKELSEIHGILSGMGCDENSILKVVEILRAQCPWFWSNEEVDWSMGVELLKDELSSDLLNDHCLIGLVKWRNAAVRAGGKNSLSDDDYNGLVAIVRRFGVENAFGEGDYWVVEDSLTTPDIFIVDFKKKIMAPEFKVALTHWIELHSRYTRISLVDEDGNVLQEIS